MYQLSEIRDIHLELTQHCQASCLMCDRNINGGKVNPHLHMDELSFDDIKKMFPVEFIKQLHSINLCGNHGDPIFAKDLLPIVKYFRECNDQLWFTIVTNGGGRSKQWWGELAEIINNKGYVIFSIDGLQDTNHKYRQGVKWEFVETAFKSFIAAGGRARWDFLIFDYNEHQIGEAKQLAKEWGFETFREKKSARFITSSASELKETHQGINKNGENTTLLAKPTDAKLQNNKLSKHDTIVAEYGSMDKFYDVSIIECKVQQQRSLYISAEGLVLPCCWTAGRMYKWWHKDPTVEQIWKFINNVGGKNNIDLHYHNFKEIFDLGLFNDIENSWKINGCNNGKLKVCAMKCSTNFDIVRSQYE